MVAYRYIKTYRWYMARLILSTNTILTHITVRLDYMLNVETPILGSIIVNTIGEGQSH